jgi:heterodisulfide reductase subunit C
VTSTQNKGTAMERITIEKSDPGWIEEVDSDDFLREFRGCLACGTCSAGCPVRRVTALYDPLKVVRMLVLGLREELLKGEMIWLCSDCYTCQENCPMGIKLTDIINHLKNLAVKEENVPLGVSTQEKLLKDQGKIYVIDEFDNKKRSKAGLPLLPAMAEQAKLLLEKRKQQPKGTERDSR